MIPPQPFSPLFDLPTPIPTLPIHHLIHPSPYPSICATANVLLTSVSTFDGMNVITVGFRGVIYYSRYHHPPIPSHSHTTTLTYHILCYTTTVHHPPPLLLPHTYNYPPPPLLPHTYNYPPLLLLTLDLYQYLSTPLPL